MRRNLTAFEPNCTLFVKASLAIRHSHLVAQGLPLLAYRDRLQVSLEFHLVVVLSMISTMDVIGRETENERGNRETETEIALLSAIVNEMYETETATASVKKIETARQTTATPSASKLNVIGTEITE